jgi:hypothetical protein
MQVTHPSCGGMLNKLPTIGIRLGPGGYGKNILLAYNTNHAKLNRSIETRENVISKRGTDLGMVLRFGRPVHEGYGCALYNARSAMTDCWDGDEATNSKEVTYVCRNRR